MKFRSIKVLKKQSEYKMDNNKNFWTIIIVLIIIVLLVWLFTLDRPVEDVDDPLESLGSDELEDIDSQLEEIEIPDIDEEFREMDDDLEELEQ